ncbi:dihydrodipicolinate reductase C-terminal domain-containing protein [Noviherbaspirillum autotrophicum]|uniref:Dihydrodipicolinate reductase n=1 Tax=Noviherbaspirillum autotrophicum TaxID=709839 RepID=A0A0C1Y2J2_9BURK|nr:dihydrodipicolinate reductase C-terminal domain-containing protein [Noviherbaspirillum autotrophicum]KIF81313.1 dihydrodipicolinate reductase [Noviherbaspirillum autotrophicum]
MQVYIAGTGKLSTELLEKLIPLKGLSIARWPGESASNAKSIVVHAGSGREIGSITEFCSRTSSVLVELSTGSSLEGTHSSFPVVLCPNTNILMLKFMCMLERSGAMFTGCEIQITESHQASKTSVPGTAVQMANSLGVVASDITSVRNPAQQAGELAIPNEHLSRHAFHRITIQDGPCTISMETRVYGDSPYASGVQQIIGAVNQRKLESRVYSITEFIENGWV